MGVPDKMFVTADCVTFCYEPEMGLAVLLVERGGEPFKGRWALPGGFVDLDEDLEVAARRELKEETGIEADYVEQFGAFGKPGRDPRGRNVTIAHLAIVGHGRTPVSGGDDAADARWFPVTDVPELAFDHHEIAEQGLCGLGSLLTCTCLAYLLLPEVFTMDDLGDLLQQATGGYWDEDDVLEFLMAGNPEMVEPGPTPEQSSFRCTVDDYESALPSPEEILESMEETARALGFESLDQVSEMMDEMDDYDFDEF